MTYQHIKQTKRHSILEALVNVIVGMVIAFTISQLAHYFEPEIQHYIWNKFVWKLSAESNLIMTCVLTILSLARGYIVRRIFNKL